MPLKSKFLYDPRVEVYADIHVVISCFEDFTFP